MTDLDDFDDLEVQPDDDDEGYVRIRKDDLKQIRRAARGKGAAERELAELQREKKVRAAGLDGLSERQINALAREAGDDADNPEKLRELAVEFGWAPKPELSDDDRQRETELNGQHDAAQVANGAEPPAQRTQVPAEQINGWPADKLMRLNDQHPDLYDLVLQGEAISLPPGFN